MPRRASARGALPTLLALAAASPACSQCHAVERAPGEVTALDTELEGLSGLTRDADGSLWTVAERGAALARIDPATSRVRVLPIDGVPEDLELEAVAWLGPGHFAVGTESQEPGRASDRLLFATVENGRATVTSSEACRYAPWNLTASENHGLEGLCAAGSWIVVATELVAERGGGRWAPVARFEASSRRWTPFTVRLTSDTGKLSAIDCRLGEGAIEVLAVERHFGVARLLRFRLPTESEGGPVATSVALDLATQVAPLPNFEGLVWEPDGSALLLTDNHFRVSTGEPSRLYRVPAAWLRGSAPP